MADTLVATIEELEARVVRLAERPITFDEFLALNFKGNMELIDGVMVEKMAAQLAHEKLIAWLFTMLSMFVRHRNLGLALVSRATVKINGHRGHLPDLLFVRQDRLHILQQRAIEGTPDLVIELISPNDRPSDRIALETDYCSIGVPEIVFIDQQKRQVLLLRLRENGYDRLELNTGSLEIETVPGFAVQLDWLFDEPRPDEFDLLRTLLNE